jgi:hypothetical protein
MANFSVPKTGIVPKTTSWEYYIEHKEDWERYKTILKVETKKSDSLWIKYKKDFIQSGELYKNGASVLLLDNHSHFLEKGKKVYANVKINGITGLLPISHLGKPKRNTTEVEDIALSNLNKAIKDRMLGNQGVCIIVKSGKEKLIFMDAVGARTNSGTPKSDFTIINSKGEDICFISHKASGGASAYQQYSGISKLAGTIISENTLVETALIGFAKNHSKIIDDRQRFKYEIPFTTIGKKLMNLAIYGPDYGSANFGINNVNFIAQGDPSLIEYKKKKSDPKSLCMCGHIYELTFSDNISINGDLTHFKESGYRPHIIARYTSGRKFSVGNTTYTGVRVLIAPDALSKPHNTTELYF